MNGRTGTTQFASAAVFVALVAAAGALSGAQPQLRAASPSPGLPTRQTKGAPAPERVSRASVGTGTIKGRVVDGTTGAPLARARVRIQSGPAAPRKEILTDATGAFSFSGLSPGAYTLAIEKVPYLPARFPDSGRSLRTMRLMVQDADSVDITVPLQRFGAIAGRVVDAHGDPVENARVTALWLPPSGRPLIRSSAQTNDLGEFRVGKLAAGRYLIQLRPEMQSSGGPPEMSDTPIRQPVPAYYPNAHSISDAQPVSVNSGETVQGIVLSLGEGSPTLVTGSVVSSDGQGMSSGNVHARFAGIDALSSIDGYGSAGIQQDGTFRLQLPPGEYILEATIFPRTAGGQPGRPGQQLFGSARVSLNGSPRESLNIVVGRGATASGRIVFEGAPPPPIPPKGVLRVPLINPGGPGCRAASVTVAADWTFKAEGLGGTCSAATQAFLDRWVLKAVMFQGRNLMEEVVAFETGQQHDNVQIVMTDRRPRLDLIVSGPDGQPTRDYVAIVFPLDREKWKHASRFVRNFATTAAAPTTTTTRISVNVLPPGMFIGCPRVITT